MKYYSIKKILNIKKIYKYKKNIFKLFGWIKTKRISKTGITFIDINDGTCLNNLQIILNSNNIKKYNKIIYQLHSGCSIKAKGYIKNNFINNNNELYATKFKILGKIKNPKKYPISPKYHSLTFLRTICHLRNRTKLFSAISRIRNSIIYYIHQFFQKKKYLLINTPIITSLDTEGYSNMFNIKYKDKKFFNHNTYLSVSGQLNLESCVCSLSKVYNISPVFRAENSNTNKHLSEFWMLETEIAYYKLNNIINLSKKLIKNILKKTLKNNYEDLLYVINFYNKNYNLDHIYNIINNKYIEIDYSEIINILKNENIFKKYNIKWGINISTEYEKFLTEKYFKNAIIIKNFPKNIKPFYMKINTDNLSVSSMDIILPNIGEIIGGSEREINIKILKKNIKYKKLDKLKYKWYIELRKYGNIQHSGFGLGIERIIMYITKINNIRDTIAFPRYPNNANF